MPLTILEGSTFCVSDELGDISEPTMGLFAHDTRFLSRWVLTINGARPLMLSSRKVEYYSAAFFLRNPVVGDLAHDEISIARERFIGDSMQEQPRRLESRAAAGRLRPRRSRSATTSRTSSPSRRTTSRSATPTARSLFRPPSPAVYEADENQFVFSTSENGFHGLTQVVLSERGETDDSKVTYRIELGPRETWRLRADVIPATDGMRTAVQLAERRFGDELARVRASLAAWRLRVPQLRGSWDDLTHSFRQSVADLSSLRMDEDTRVPGQLPAAGMPWFMTVFGRDTLITCLQTLLFGPELAQNALAVLAELQARDDDPGVGRGAREDRPRGPPRQGRRGLVPALLRHGRRDAALPRPPLGGLALDRRRRPRARPARAGAARARVDRPLRRPRRRRLRRVPAPLVSRARQPVLEGLGRLAALPRRPARRGADRAVRGAGLRLRRQAAAGRAGARGLARARAGRAARSARPPSCAGASTRPSGARAAAATTRSPSTPTSSGSTRSPRISATCSGAGSSRRSAWTRSSTS